ncbi:MAG: 50S ribosomal protein L1 [Legionellaceae bacterium]|jgi:large subunit ribosomal protein L1|nr:50S ribosomal protein L1 [Legionellaceae bacterium]
MTTITKKKKAIKAKLQPGKLYSLSDAVVLLKSFASQKFSEAVDVAVNLGLDPRKSDQMVRGATSLPKGTGKTVRVAVFAQGENAVKAKEAGADIVGFEDLAEQIKAGDMPFDVVIATPDSMRIVGQLGQILGPRGLMPNPKVGTVTMNVAAAVADVKSGQVRYRTDKNGIIHCSVGKIEFSEADLAENISALLSDLKKAKPTAAKGVYIRKLTISTTMGPGIALDLSSVFV